MTTVEMNLDLTDRRARKALRAILAEFDDELDGEAEAAPVWRRGSAVAAEDIMPRPIRAADIVEPVEVHTIPSPSPAPAPEAAAIQEPPVEPDWPALVARVLGGADAKAVADEAGVKVQALRMRVTRAKHPGMGVRQAPAEPPADDTGPEPAPAEPGAAEQPAGATPEADAGGDDEAAAEEAAPEATASGDWAPQEDLVVLRWLTQGKNTYYVASQLPGRKASDVVARYRELVPKVTLAAQQEALKLAEARVREHRIAAE